MNGESNQFKIDGFARFGEQKAQACDNACYQESRRTPSLHSNKSAISKTDCFRVAFSLQSHWRLGGRSGYYCRSEATGIPARPRHVERT